MRPHEILGAPSHQAEATHAPRTGQTLVEAVLCLLERRPTLLKCGQRRCLGRCSDGSCFLDWNHKLVSTGGSLDFVDSPADTCAVTSSSSKSEIGFLGHEGKASCSLCFQHGGISRTGSVPSGSCWWRRSTCLRAEASAQEVLDDIQMRPRTSHTPRRLMRCSIWRRSRLLRVEAG